MIIFHGHPAPSQIQLCQDHAPSFTHGAEWSHQKMTPHDWPYILDNGAFSAYVNNEPWDVDAFVGRLSQIDSMPRRPEFVVLPDVVTDPSATKKRALQWSGVIEYTTAYPVQDGISPSEAAELCDKTNSEYIFVGGTTEWKRRNAKDFVDIAHENGLKCHIGRPGDLLWAKSIGADSVDTTSIVRNESWHRLQRLESADGQSALTAY